MTASLAFAVNLHAMLISKLPALTLWRKFTQHCSHSRMMLQRSALEVMQLWLGLLHMHGMITTVQFPLWLYHLINMRRELILPNGWKLCLTLGKLMNLEKRQMDLSGDWALMVILVT